MSLFFLLAQQKSQEKALFAWLGYLFVSGPISVAHICGQVIGGGGLVGQTENNLDFLVNFNFLEYINKSDGKDKSLRVTRDVKAFLNIVLNYVTHLMKLIICFPWQVA